MPLNQPRRRGPARQTLAAGVVLAALLLASPAAATVFLTSKTADTADGVCDWDCSLREAVHAANARRGSDVIVLRPGVYRLEIPVAADGDTEATGDLDLLDLLVISGAGAGLTAIDGGGLDRVLDVGPAATVELLDLTVRHGTALSGGGIRNAGALTLSRVTVRDNEAAGGAGGGILSSGPQAALTLAASTVAGNQAAGDGGGIFAGGSLQLRNATLSGNFAGGGGGGLLVLPATNTALANVTLVLNTATTEGGGILAASPTAVANSIVAANQAPAAPDVAGAVLSAGHNLWGVGAELVLAPGDRAGSAEAPLDPSLAPLASNGGPTETHFPGPGSPAIDAGGSGAEGEPACQARDQRGAARGDAAAERCDIGAVETTRACVAGGSHLCLAGGRFEVAAHWRTAAASGPAQAVPLTADSGSFWFFEPSKLELTVKLVDGCAFNGRHWFFASGLTDVEVALTVRDTSSGAVRQRTSAGGRAFPTLLDTAAFACP